MNATWKCWLNRLMNRGAGAVRALGFTTRRAVGLPRRRLLRLSLGSLALGGMLSTAAWAQSPAGESGVVRLGGGAANVAASDGVVRLGDPSAAVSADAAAVPSQYAPEYAPQYGSPMYAPYGGPPMMADPYAPSYNNGVGYTATRDIERILYRVGTTAGDIYGAAPGYTNFNAFIPFASNGDNALWYIQPRGGVSHDGGGIANVGVGARWYTYDDDRTWSATFWWDGDGGHRAFYNQMGMHFSSVGRYLTWRGGFALPVGSETETLGSTVSDIFYVSDNIGFNVATNVETAYRRYDLEASTPIPLLGRYGWDLGVGMYYLQGPNVEDGMGVSVRTEAQVTENFWINGLVTSDDIFGSNFSINMELTIPDGAPSTWFRRKTPRDAMFESDKRNYRVAAAVNTVHSEQLALDPRTGQPIRIAHIDPNLTTAGNGTIETPFGSVFAFESLNDADQADYNLIFVRRRSDGSDTNLNTTITLFDYQRLLGDGTLPSGGVHTFDALIAGTQQTFNLPGVTAGALPQLTNSGAPGQNVVRLASANEVAGFQINAGGNAAGIRGVGVDGFNLHDLVISNATQGIAIVSDTTSVMGVPNEDYGIIRNVTVTGPGAIPFPALAGISVEHVDGELDLLVLNNQVTGYNGEDANNNNVINIGEDVNGNGVLDGGAGIRIVSEGPGVINASDFSSQTRRTGILNNTVTGNDTNLLLIAIDGGEFTAAVNGNTVSNNLDPASAGFVAIADNALLTLSSVGSNSFTNNQGDGVLLEALNGGTLYVPEYEPVLNGGFDDLNGNGVRDFGFIQNTITGNTGAGVRILADGPGSLADVSIGGNGVENTIAGNSGGGIVFQADDEGVINVGQLVSGNTSGNVGAFIRVAGDGGTINLGVIENTIFDRRTTGAEGILFDASNANITGVIRNNQFLGSTANGDLSFGIGGEIRGGTLDLTIENNVFDGNADAAIGLILGESDDRPAPGVGTPLQGTAAAARLVITENLIVSTRDGANNRFNGDGIAIIMDGQESDQGIPVPPGSPPDPTTTVQPAAFLEGLIAENIIGVDIRDDSVDLNDPETWNPADGNAGAGIYIELNGDTAITDLANHPDIGTLPIDDDPELFGMVIGAYTYQGRDYSGNVIVNNNEGIQVRRNDSSIIDNFEINGNLIEYNLNDGIDIQVQNSGLQYGVFEILDFDINGNIIRNNGRLAPFGGVAGATGITGRGIQLRAHDAAILEVNIANNLIEGNWNGGIEARTSTATHLWTGRDSIAGSGGGSEGVIYGVWEENVIRGNGIFVAENANGNGIADLRTSGHGIALGRIDLVDQDNPGRVLEGYNNGGLLVDTDGDGVGDTPASLLIQNNLITLNGRDGIHMYFDKSRIVSTVTNSARSSIVDVLNNDITNNGEDGLSVHNVLASDLFLTFNENLVTGNGVYSEVFSIQLAGGNAMNVVGDGVEIVTAGGSQTFLTANNNRIKENNGRGVNLLTAVSGYLDAEFDSNNISSNVREGFYLVNAPLNVTPVTPTPVPNPDPYFYFDPANFYTGYGYTGVNITSWHADMDSNHEMFEYGFDPVAGDTPPAGIINFLIDYTNPANLISDAPVTDLVFTRNLVSNNGSVRPDADGEPPYSTIGGFVMRVGSATSDPNTIPPTAPFPGPPPVVEPSVPIPGQVGGVRARVTDNSFFGNVGRDFYIDGFVATEPPRVDFAPDPLIRIDMVFNNNRGGSIDVQFGAFYSNTGPNPGGFSDNNVKSPPEVFGAGNEGRLRSVTNNLGMALFEVDDGVFEWRPYPGLGTTTLRVDLLPGPNNYGPFGIGNNLFNNVYSSFFTWQEVDGPNDPTFVVP
ncbi:MAG: hypothetical protein KF774_02960 [Planctomyces sp.]|nr:hypothetical protein [Planctomyces sp.]